LSADAPINPPARTLLGTNDEQEQQTSDGDQDLKAAERQQWKDDLLLDFAQFDSNLIRAQLIFNSNERERSRYAEEKIKIRDTAQAVRGNNASLHEQLRQAQRTLEVRKGYDKLTEKITSNKTLKPRTEQQVAIDKLHAEIAELEAESREYARTRAERGEQFSKIVAECKGLYRLIHEDQEEVERTGAMDDTNDERTSSRGATPAGGSTPAHAPAVPEMHSPSHGSKLREEAMAVEPIVPAVQGDKPEPDTEGKMISQLADEMMDGGVADEAANDSRDPATDVDSKAEAADPSHDSSITIKMDTS